MKAVASEPGQKPENQDVNSDVDEEELDKRREARARGSAIKKVREMRKRMSETDNAEQASALISQTPLMNDIRSSVKSMATELEELKWQLASSKARATFENRHVRIV